jgi:2'-5' RNA ligase
MKGWFSLGLDVDLRVAELLTLVQEELGPWLEAQGGSPRWVPSPQLRVPLKVMRGVEEALRPQILSTVGQVTAALVPFKVGLQGVSVLPDARSPRLLAARLSLGGELVTGLHRLLEAKLEGIGLDRDPRPFVAMVPLGRVCTPGPELDLGPLIGSLERLSLGESYVKSVVAWSTQVGSKGVEVEIKGRLPLGR